MVMSVTNDNSNLCEVLYKESGQLACYDFFLKLTRPEIAEKVEKLKLHSTGIFERAFWEDLELSKNTFPHLRKISIKDVKFNLFNLKFFKNTSIDSFDFRKTTINKLEYIEFLLRENKRVLINDKRSEDTAYMAILHAYETCDYTYMAFAIQTGSWRRKITAKLAEELLNLSVKEGHLEGMNKWAKDLNLTKNIPDVISQAISIIKHPLVTVKALEENECIEPLLGYSKIINNPVFNMLYHSKLSEQDKNLIQIQMSKNCLENMFEFELRARLGNNIKLETLLELSHLAEMYNWESLRKHLINYKISCHELWDNAWEDTIGKFNALLADHVQHIPDFMKKSILNQAINFLELDEHIEVFKEGYRVTLHESLIQMVKMLPSTLNVHLRIDLSSLDLSTQEELKTHGPYDNVNCLEIINSDDNLISSLYSLVSSYRKLSISDVCVKMKLLSTLFPACLEVNVSELDYESYKEDLDPIFLNFKDAVIRYDFI
jgi:hypothetical protein